MDENQTKHPGGRPPIFGTVKELQKAVDEYFDWCDNRIVKKVESDGKEFVISAPAPYTMSGLARRLGMDRTSLVNYAHRDKFFDTIRTARNRVHEDVEIRLMETRNEKGAIFNLKNNFGWKDETKTDITSGGRPIPILPTPADALPTNNSNQEVAPANQENQGSGGGNVGV